MNRVKNLFVFILLLSSPLAVFSQFQLGVTGGFYTCNFIGIKIPKSDVPQTYLYTNKNTPRTGYNAGLVMHYYFSPELYFSSGIVVSQYNYQLTTQDNSTPGFRSEFTMSQTALHIPIGINYDFLRKKFRLGIGIGLVIDESISDTIVYKQYYLKSPTITRPLNSGQLRPFSDISLSSYAGLNASYKTGNYTIGLSPQFFYTLTGVEPFLGVLHGKPSQWGFQLSLLYALSKPKERASNAP